MGEGIGRNVCSNAWLVVMKLMRLAAIEHL
jgi:hypothetical protein